MTRASDSNVIEDRLYRAIEMILYEAMTSEQNGRHDGITHFFPRSAMIVNTGDNGFNLCMAFELLQASLLALLPTGRSLFMMHFLC